MKAFITQTDSDFSLLDTQTGEIKEWKRTRIVSVDDFIMIFFSSIPELMKLKGQYLKVLVCCWKHSTYNSAELEGNILHNDKLFKDYIRSCGLDLTNGTIDVIIHKLASENMLIRKYKGVYMLNPKYFFKGRIAEKSKLELRITTDVED